MDRWSRRVERRGDGLLGLVDCLEQGGANLKEPVEPGHAKGPEDAGVVCDHDDLAARSAHGSLNRSQDAEGARVDERR